MYRGGDYHGSGKRRKKDDRSNSLFKKHLNNDPILLWSDRIPSGTVCFDVKQMDRDPNCNNNKQDPDPDEIGE